MDDDKSIAEKFADTVSKAADSVKNTMSHIVDTASQAAQYAMESTAEKISAQAAEGSDPAQTAAAANAPILIPEPPDAAAMPAPLIFAPATVKSRRKPRARSDSSKPPKTNKAVAKKLAKSLGKRKAKASARGQPKKAKKTAAKSAAKSGAKQSAAKKTRKKKTRKQSKR